MLKRFFKCLKDSSIKEEKNIKNTNESKKTDGYDIDASVHPRLKIKKKQIHIRFKNYFFDLSI